jgi:glycosyltransferase involved in cell wall biosynthesis
MRIGIDCRLWNETGVGRYIRNLVMNLAEIDTSNDYILFLRKKEYDTLITPGNNFRKRLADVQWHSLAEQTTFLTILYKENLDLVHFPYFSFPLFYARPFVITIHDLILFYYPTGKASQLPEPLYQVKLFAYKRMMYHAAVHAKKIIAVSNATKNELVHQLNANPEKIMVTYEGENLETPRAPLGADNGFHIPNQYFLYVGNAYPHKNLEKFLKAFQEFTEEVSQVDLVLVGKEDYYYEQLQRKILDFRLVNSVTLLTSVTDAQLQSLYRGAIALVMPSLMEGFGLPTVEAMANNCLVLASGIPSLREICQDAAVYFNPLDRDAMRNALKNAYYNQAALAANKKIGLERAKVFSWRKMAEETLQVYISVPPTISTKLVTKNAVQK